MKQVPALPSIGRLVSPLLMLLLVTGCGGSDSSNDTSGASDSHSGRLQKTRSEAELLVHIRTALLERYGVMNNYPIAYNDAVPVAATAAEGASAAAVSSTNVQEAGVDEADRIKSDGRYLYVSSREQPTLLVYETDAATSTPVAKIALETEGNNPLQGLYLQQGRLTAIAQNTGYYGYPLAATFVADALPYPGTQSNPATQVFMFDRSQPALPQQRAELSIDGSLISSRMIGSRLYLATRHTATVSGIEYYPADESAAATNRDKINQTGLQDLLPHYRINGLDQGQLFSAADCFVAPYSNKASTNIVSLISIDVSSDNPQPQGQCFVGDAETLYASAAAVYLATTQYPMYTLALVDDTAEVSDEVSALPANSITTDLHKFSLTAGAINYKGSGQIKGHLGWQQDLKPFRMSEHDGVLRVITYIGDNQSGATAALHTLKENTREQQSLDILAELPNTGRPAPLGKPGEQIYATRFAGERGYLVTFRATDPLYILDLSNPADPFIISELEIEGYSDYLHPVGENFLLGIGKDAIAATASGNGDGRGAWYQGVKLSLIDITDPTQPFEKQKILLGKRGSNTAVSSTHHALSSLQRGDTLRLTLPLSRHENPNQYNTSLPANDPSYYYGWTNDELVRLEVDSVNGVITQLSSMISDTHLSGDGYSNGWADDRSVMIEDALHYLHSDQVMSQAW